MWELDISIGTLLCENGFSFGKLCNLDKIILGKLFNKRLYENKTKKDFALSTSLLNNSFLYKWKSASALQSFLKFPYLT